MIEIKENENWFIALVPKTNQEERPNNAISGTFLTKMFLMKKRWK